MEPKKRWDGYRSFDYLEPGRDYEPFELEPQIGRVEPFVYPLPPADEGRAGRLLHGLICISLHDHCGITPKDMGQNEAYVRAGRESYGYEGLAASGLDAVFGLHHVAHAHNAEVQGDSLAGLDARGMRDQK